MNSQDVLSSIITNHQLYNYPRKRSVKALEIGKNFYIRQIYNSRIQTMRTHEIKGFNLYKSIKRILVILIVSIFFHCGNLEGDFGWATTNEEGISPLEEEFRIHTEFQVSREELFFSQKDTIHFVYIFKSSVNPSQEFFFSLNKKSIEYLEIDLRRKRIEEGNAVIRDKYVGLDIGDYLLKVAYEGNVFDSVEFKILPDDGYFTENLERDLNKGTEDEIIIYSR